MDIIFAIRSGIFLTAGLIVLIFPKQVFRWSSRMIARLAKIFHIKYTKIEYTETEEKHGIKANIVLGICFLVIAVILFLIAIIRFNS